VAEAVIVLRVLRQSDRTDRLLELIGSSLLERPLTAHDDGTVPVRLPRRGPQAWDQLRDALDEAGPDWRQWLHLPPRPQR